MGQCFSESGASLAHKIAILKSLAPALQHCTTNSSTINHDCTSSLIVYNQSAPLLTNPPRDDNLLSSSSSSSSSSQPPTPTRPHHNRRTRPLRTIVPATMEHPQLAFLGHDLFFKLSLIIMIAGFVAALLSLGQMSEHKDEQGTIYGNDPAYLQLALGIIIFMVGAFGALAHYIHKTGRFLAHLGYSNNMIDNIRADVAAQDIELGPLRQPSPVLSARPSARSYNSLPSTIPRSSYSSNRPLLPVEPAQVHLPPPTLDEPQLLLD
ncbi:hypothetical protein N431DRAFT_555553 [Stipitochalara longipes BDJ]|nr:hypothetical protein N431DRAFT_555553 [Stipitochalara longipes BDJ]